MVETSRRLFYEPFLRKQPRQARSRSVVRAILHAGIESLTTGGDEAITMEAVARRAGVGIGSVYDYFSDRRALVAAIVAACADHALRRTEAALATTVALDLEVAAGRIVDAVHGSYAADPAAARNVTLAAINLGLMPIFVEATARSSGALASALRERPDVDADSVECLSQIFCQTLLGQVIAMTWRDHSEGEIATLRSDLVRLFVNGLRRAAA
jgi:AcrR family transcriptional regulator